MAARGFVFAALAWLAGCRLPLSHACHTSEDCLGGACVDGVCGPGDGGASSTDASMKPGVDASPDVAHDVPAEAGVDGLPDVAGDAAGEATVDMPRDVEADGGSDMGADGGSDDAADGGSDMDADGGTDAATDGGSDTKPADALGDEPASDLVVRPPACPAWADWPMPSPPTLTGFPDPLSLRNLPNPQSYDTSDPDVVLDNVTRLVWQRVVSPDAMNWFQAASYCDALTVGGRDDWRLPSRIELVSLIDITQSQSGNIDTLAFPNSALEGFWTCTPGPAMPTIAWIVDFFNGMSGSQPKLSRMRVRCVAGSVAVTPPPERYDLGTPEEVHDLKTLLTWTTTITVGTWGDAFDYCYQRPGGWRLPSLNELQTLLDETQVKSAVDALAFPDRPDSYYWTSSMFDRTATVMWFASIGEGNTYWAPTTDVSLARCVR